MAAYAASKAAAAMFTKSLGLEVARLGIRCNVVAHGHLADLDRLEAELALGITGEGDG